MEALGDAVVFGEAPHAYDLVSPFGQGLRQRDSGLEAVLAHGVDEAEEGADMIAAGGLVLSLQG
jgi:hypothetical protein